MRLFSAGTTFNDVRIPFPHVRVTGLAARSALDNLQREHPTATPIIVGGDGADDSLDLLFDEQLVFPFPPEEVEECIERSLQDDGWSLQLAYERDLHDRMLPRLKEINAPGILIRSLSERPRLDEKPDVANIMNQPWPELPPDRPTDLRCAASSDIVLIVMIPTVRPWEAAAYLGFGGINACPAPWVHVAYAREWSARFGARLLVLTQDTLEFDVARPITSREDAAAMAAVHAYYCSDTFGTDPSIVEHAAYLLGARLWQFWWD
jgi:Domain of unknown function (DUF4253)